MKARFGSRLVRSNFFIKLRSWEYWPFGIIQFPFFIYWLWLSMRARSLLFFSASNPGIPTGGMLGESKYDVLKKIPRAYVPAAALITLPTTAARVQEVMREQNLTFPVIFKPDIGERGWMVRRIHNEEEATGYVASIKTSFIVQELVDLPLEFGVYYCRFPDQGAGAVTSVVIKEMLSVEGDGVSTLQTLILRKDRARLQWETLRTRYGDRLGSIPRKGEKIELVSIGNHCLGTKFLNGNHLINDRLSQSFDRISRQIDGFFFGRYDLRAATMEDFYEGRVYVMELNGCGAEPAHIYQPGYPLGRALRDMARHWRDLFKVSMQNHARGVPFMSLREGWQVYKKFRKTITG